MERTGHPVNPTKIERQDSKESKQSAVGQLQGVAVSVGDPGQARSAAADFAAQRAEDARLSNPPSRVTAESKATGSSRLQRVPEKLVTEDVVPVGWNEENGWLPRHFQEPGDDKGAASLPLHYQYMDPLPPFSESTPAQRGEHLLAAALLSPTPMDRIHACFEAVDIAVTEQPTKEMEVLRQLMEQLDDAVRNTAAPKFVGSSKAREMIEQARTAIFCRMGKYLGITTREAAREQAWSYMGDGAPTKGAAIVKVTEEGFRHAAGDYRTAFKLGGDSPETRVAKALAVAMNQHDNIRTAWAEVLAQIEKFDGSAAGKAAMMAAADKAITQASRLPAK